MLRLHILNGPNLNLVGEREPHIYGNQSLTDYLHQLSGLYADVANIQVQQTNHEGQLIDWVQEARHGNGIIINPGGLTHTSISLRDAIAAITCPVIEVHLSNIYAREEFRRHSVISAVCKGQISGLGFIAYSLAIQCIIEQNKTKL